MKGYMFDCSSVSPSDFSSFLSQFDDGRAVANPHSASRIFDVYIEDSENITELFDLPAGCKVSPLPPY